MRDCNDVCLKFIYDFIFSYYISFDNCSANWGGDGTLTTTIHMLTIIVLCGVVTWITRIIPFILITKIKLSEGVIKWLSFIPITLFTALIIDGLIEQQDGVVGYSINVPFLITMLPTIVIAVISRSLTITILSGIVIMAVLRWVF